jgi:hypothetical protein
MDKDVITGAEEVDDVQNRESASVKPGVNNGSEKDFGEPNANNARCGEARTQGVENGYQWSCATAIDSDSESQVSDIVNNILANASKAVHDHISKGGSLVGDDCNKLKPYPTTFQSISPRFSSPVHQEKTRECLKKEVDSYNDLPTSSNETSDTVTVSQDSLFEESKVLSDKLRALRSQFSEAYFYKAKPITREYHYDNSCVASSERFEYLNPSSKSSEDESGNETRFIQDGVEVYSFDSFVKASEVGEEENTRDFDTKTESPKTKTKKVDPENNLRAETIVWKALHPLITSSRDAILNSDELDSSKEHGAVWKAPVPLICLNTFTKEQDSSLDSESSPQLKVQREERDSNLPGESRVSEKEASYIVSRKVVESVLPERIVVEQHDGLVVMEPANRVSDTDLLPIEQVTGMDELLVRFQHLRSGDDLVPDISPGDAAKETAINEESAKAEDFSPIKETLASRSREQDKGVKLDDQSGSESGREPTEKGDIFSTENSKLYHGYIDISGDQEGSLTSQCTSSLSVHTNEDEDLGEKIAGLFERHAEEDADQIDLNDEFQEGKDKSAESGSEHVSDLLAEEDDAGEAFSRSSSKSESKKSDEVLGVKDAANDEETEVNDRVLILDDPVQSKKTEEPKTNISSDFKSSIDTSVWSASDEEIPKYDDREMNKHDNDEVKDVSKFDHGAAVYDIQPGNFQLPSSLGHEQSAGIANVRSMFDVPPPRIPEAGCLHELYHRGEEVKAEDVPETKLASKTGSEEDLEETRYADDSRNDKPNTDSSKFDKKQRKTRKFRRRGSIGKGVKQAQVEEQICTEIQQRHGSRQKRDKVRTAADISGEGSEKTEPEVNEKSEDRMSQPEKGKRQSQRKGKRNSNTRESEEKTERAPQEGENDEPIPDIKDKEKDSATAEGKASRETSVRKPRRTSSVRLKSEEPNLKFNRENHDTEGPITEISSERHSRWRPRKPRAPKISETLYHQHQITNEDMLNGKYVELFEIMRSDGVKTGELVKEIGLVLAKAGLSPRSPWIPVSPQSSPHVEKLKPKVTDEKQDKFIPMPGVHVIPTESKQPVPVSKPVPADRKSLKRHFSDSSQEKLIPPIIKGDSFERMQKQLYRKYDELNALLYCQLPDEAACLVQEQLEQTLHLLNRSQKQGHFHSGPESGKAANSRHSLSQG